MTYRFKGGLIALPFIIRRVIMKIKSNNPNQLTPEEERLLDNGKTNKGNRSFNPTAEQIKEYKRLRQNVLAKSRRLRKANSDAWLALGGKELEKKQSGKTYEKGVIHKYLDAKAMATNPSGAFYNKKEFEKELQRMRNFTKRGGEFEQIESAKTRLIRSIINVGYNSPDVDDVVDYIRRMPIATFGQIFTTEEAYSTIEDIYLEDDNLDYLERFKSYSGYYAYTGEESEKNWSKNFKRKYGRDVTL